MGDIPTIANLNDLFTKVVSSLIALSGIVLFIFIVIGGVKYITSGGDPKATESAQKTITYAISGLALLILSYMILVLIKTMTGVDVQNFTITQ